MTKCKGRNYIKGHHLKAPRHVHRLSLGYVYRPDESFDDLRNKVFLLNERAVGECMTEEFPHLPMLSRISLAHYRVSLVRKAAPVVELALDKGLMALAEPIYVLP